MKLAYFSLNNDRDTLNPERGFWILILQNEGGELFRVAEEWFVSRSRHLPLCMYKIVSPF